MCIRDRLVQYAAARNSEIIPEIDVPGHNQALCTAYPELDVYKRQRQSWKEMSFLSCSSMKPYKKLIMCMLRCV